MHFKTKFLFLKEACAWVYFSLCPGIVLLREDSNGKSPQGLGGRDARRQKALTESMNQYKFLILQPKDKQDRLTDIRVMVNDCLNPPVIIRKGEL